jgi:hypothetical protein
MTEPINLRAVRKRAKRKEDEAHASANRLAYGQPKDARRVDEAERTKAIRHLDGHRIEREGDR